MSDYKNPLEEWFLAMMKEIDPSAYKTPGSGCGNHTGDIACKEFFVECKIKSTKSNITMRYKEEWLDLLKKMPIVTHKKPIIVIENQLKEKFVVMSAEDFFKLLKEKKDV